ncbi:hypothetical protein BFW01_g11756 [Lasiodiplodia theobromae]|uniref:ribonuclease T1 n=1 Tax=Lasiodiplodia theobromae TaxID=45133 RepID=A0A5N5CZZ2_9PEZI|nr:hypothetical protein DBV05_g10345 [Lasiodiplodia theobromae]KAF9639950.1 hypothetical protein BFW01_g11756 [Lasiodiplodia theobromae]
MHFIQILSIALFAAAQVGCAAVPAAEDATLSPEARDVLLSRANPSPQAVICGPSNNQQKYDKDAVKKAYDNGKKYWKKYDDSRCYNGNCFPKQYGGNGGNVRSNLPDECDVNTRGSALVEWPIMANGKAYANGVNPDNDRVIMWDRFNNGTIVIFCGVISHRGLGGSSFNWCKKDSS